MPRSIATAAITSTQSSSTVERRSRLPASCSRGAVTAGIRVRLRILDRGFSVIGINLQEMSWLAGRRSRSDRLQLPFSQCLQQGRSKSYREKREELVRLGREQGADDETDQGTVDRKSTR